MKAARFYGPNTPLRVEEVPIPEVGPKDVLVKVRASGICGSDLHALHGAFPEMPVPVTMGHECAGIVEEVGEEVTTLSEGDRVCMDYVVSCGYCEYCSRGNNNLCDSLLTVGFELDGSFAEYVCLPEKQFLKLPKNIPFDEGAILGCAVVTPYHALRVAEVRAGDHVAIYGAGGVGIHAVQLARIFGASKLIVVEVSEYKLKTASELGADETVNALEEDPVKRIKEETSGKGCDVVLVFTGSRKAVEQALRSVKKGGRVVLVGYCREPVSLDAMEFMSNEIQLRSSIEHNRWELARVIELRALGKIDLSKSITHRVSLDQVNRGLEILEKKIGDPLRVVVTP
ncbi:hypothetical protein DRO24_04805 [Candidatus Bathyarchaeota archaeon]|nr:MAG: hypothetical protein DRO24_04805 [Candidatus Bathyarchaeota archaeon]